MYLFPQSPIPTSGTFLMVIPGDDASGHVLSIGLIVGRDHTIYHTGLRPSRLLATITRFAKFSGLLRLWHSAHRKLRNGPLSFRHFIPRAARYRRLPCDIVCPVLNKNGDFELPSASVRPDPSFLGG